MEVGPCLYKHWSSYHVGGGFACSQVLCHTCSSWNLHTSLGESRHRAAGGCNKTVEIDETQIGHRKHGRGRDKRVAIVFDMIERGTGWTFTIPVINVKAKTLFPHIHRQVKKRSKIISDGASSYRRLSEVFNHLHVNHSKTYMLPFRDGELDVSVHTNRIEGAWAR